MIRRTFLSVCLLACVSASAASPAYFPPAGEWARKSPAEMGMNPALLEAAVAYAKSH